MIQFKLFVALCSIIIISVQDLPAQDPETITTEFHVDGVCNQCKARIENAAYIKGVKFCEWNQETEVLTVIYKPEKVELKQIHESIANAGHSTELMPADQEAYNKLPKCCLYDDGVHKH